MFALSKWYCDCVTEDGAAFIGYWARLRWGPITIPYAATLHKPPGGSIHERIILRHSAAPALTGGALSWHSPRLGFHGEWVTRARACCRTLLDGPEGRITWSCHVPSANARIELVGTGLLAGLGYAEHLTMSVKPWLLPFDELRWGRFVSTEDAITWIKWSGGADHQWTFHNGVEVRDATIGAATVDLAGGRGALELRDVATLREGPLLSTALRHLPVKRLWLGDRLHDAYETKWLAQGTLSNGARRVSGWAIHEVVRLR